MPPTAQRLGGNWLSTRRPVGANKVDLWKIAPEAGWVAGQQPVTGDGRMRADKKVREWRRALSTAAAVAEKGLTRQKCRIVRKWLSRKAIERQRVIEVFDAVKTDRYLSIDNWIY